MILLEKLEGLDSVPRTGKQVFQKIICGGGPGWYEKDKKINQCNLDR